MKTRHSIFCFHDKFTAECIECRKCCHNKRAFECNECGTLCEHRIIRNRCKHCSIVRQKPQQNHKPRKEIPLSFDEPQRKKVQCPPRPHRHYKTIRCCHDREKRLCKLCHGTSLCIHEVSKYRCKECDYAKICLHKLTRGTCNECILMIEKKHRDIQYRRRANNRRFREKKKELENSNNDSEEYLVFFIDYFEKEDDFLDFFITYFEEEKEEKEEKEEDEEERVDLSIIDATN